MARLLPARSSLTLIIIQALWMAASGLQKSTGAHSSGTSPVAGVCF
jgi:hypothetical protein